MDIDGIDWGRCFSVLPYLTGLPLERRGSRWYGRCYLTGEEHLRWDKTVCVLVEDGIILMEQGGDRKTLWSYLTDVRGLSRSEAYARMTGRSVCEAPAYVPPREKPKRYVAWSDVRETDVLGGGLYSELCGVFGEGRVSEVFRRYYVGTCGDATCFWYIDSSRRVCYDKEVRYDGFRRDRSYGARRRFRRDDGYRGECLFGEHLWKGGQACVVESEKSALVCAIRYPSRVWLATGGKNNLRQVERLLSGGADLILFPDVDGAEEWEARFGAERVFRWWEHYGCRCGEKDDFADYIYAEAKRKRGGR